MPLQSILGIADVNRAVPAVLSHVPERRTLKTVKRVVAEIFEEALAAAIEANELPEGAPREIKVEYPKEQSFGDYATPYALEAARLTRKAPMVTAEILKKYISQHEAVGSVEVARPGFINIFISIPYLLGALKTAVDEGDLFGRSAKEKPLRYNIEFVSANPTGPLNVVSARAAAIGDTLANLVEAAGDKADREYYVNDAGNQVVLFGKSVYLRLRQLEGEQIDLPEECYQGEYVIDIAREIKRTCVFDKDEFDSEEQMLEFFSTFAVDYILEGQKKAMNTFGVHYSHWFRESELHAADAVMKSLASLESHGAIFEEEGKKVFRATSFGDDKDRVVVRDDGRPTYLLADIAYHEDKFKRGYDRIIDIWGPDHHGYIARLKGAIGAMGYDAEKFSVLIAQQVNLIMDGEPVKMSKRLGRFSTMTDLIDNVGVDVSRFFFVMRSMESHLDFDLTLAARQSSENPVFYLQYAHARIASIFREAEKRGILYSPCTCDPAEYDEESVQLLKLIARFPEEIADAAAALEVHRIALYLMRLAQQFHRFYTVNRILGDDAQKTQQLLTIADASRITLKNGLALLGVSAPVQM